MKNSEKFQKGLEVRKSVLGKEFVEKSIESADEFNMPMQELTTEYCWGTIWTRDGLEKKQRSLLNLGILVALGKQHEFKLHVKGALRNGCTLEEIQEVLLQCAIYCGVPAGIEGFRLAKEAIKEYEENK